MGVEELDWYSERERKRGLTGCINRFLLMAVVIEVVVVVMMGGMYWHPARVFGYRFRESGYTGKLWVWSMWWWWW